MPSARRRRSGARRRSRRASRPSSSAPRSRARSGPARRDREDRGARSLQKEAELDAEAHRGRAAGAGRSATARCTSRQLQEELKASAATRRSSELERISGLTAQRGEDSSCSSARRTSSGTSSRATVRQMEEEARADARRRARALVADALQRVAASHTAETTVTVVELASDDLKGRIIGREGRNIRALEHLTGVDFIIDDTPHAVVLSSFDALRREIAQLTLEKLIEDGRIHPARIEEMYYQSKAELEEHDPPGGRAGRLRGELRRVPRGARDDPRPAPLPDELRAERPQAHARGRPPRRDHGRRARRGREDDEARCAPPRHRQGDDARGRGLARAHLGAARAALRRVARASSTRSRRTTTRCSRRPSRRCC